MHYINLHFYLLTLITYKKKQPVIGTFIRHKDRQYKTETETA